MLLALGDGGNSVVMDSVAFDKFWATVAPFQIPGNQSFTPPNYPTFFTMTQPKYLSTVPRDNIYRQFLSLWFITVQPYPSSLSTSIAVTNEQWIFGVILYFVFASLSYHFIFDKTYKSHPRFLASQIKKEITLTMYSLPQMAVLTAPWFLAEVRGYGKLYLYPEQYGWWYMVAQFPLFLVFTDGLIYLIHRGLHHPLVYKTLHKPHHRWIVPTPFASHAFHPIDGYSQVHSSRAKAFALYSLYHVYLSNIPCCIVFFFVPSFFWSQLLTPVSPCHTTYSPSSSPSRNSATSSSSSSSNSGPS